MKLNPKHAPLYGECVLTVQLDKGDVSQAEGTEEGDEEVEFYLLFLGSSQRHVSSTLRLDQTTLQAMCPAHNVCEQVLVTLCLAKPGKPVATHSQEPFGFVQDLALDMAHFLLNTTAPQEALLFDDEQIPLEECERLDQSLALALKHLSLSHRRTPLPTPSLTCTHCLTETITTPDVDPQKASWSSVSPLLDSCSAVSQGRQLSSLLHLAASRGLSTVASFLLQQPGAREALMTANAKGLTPACVAQGKGHKQLAELFTQYETSLDVQLERKEHLHWYQKGFQHYSDLGTYTLTLSCCQQRGEGTEANGCCIQKEIAELKRQIQLYRNIKRNSCSGTNTTLLVGLGFKLEPCSNTQHESEHDSGLAVVPTENYNALTEEQGAPPSAVERQRGTQTNKSPAGRKKKNKKRTTKTTRHANAGNNRSTLEALRAARQGPSETTETCCFLGTASPRASAETPLIDEEVATKDPSREATLPPINTEAGQADDGKCTSRKATTAITEKQEREKWEVDRLMCEQAVETKTKQAEKHSSSARRDQSVNPTKHGAASMGQEQSQNPQGNQSDQEEPSQLGNECDSRTSPGSPHTVGKPRRVLWRDGGWIESIIGSDTEAKTVWYQAENMDLGTSGESREELDSQTVWYDIDEREPEQLKETECGLSSPLEFENGSLPLVERGLSSHQLCSALSQPHAAGAVPVLSHGLATQRQEVPESQREEEAGPDWQEGGEEGVGEDVRNRETTQSRKSSATADFEEEEEKKAGEEENEAKGRKKRRRKKGKKGGSEAKLSSSSSVESQNQNETQTEENTLNPLSNADSEKNQTGRTRVHSPTITEATWVKEEPDEDSMHLPRRTDHQTGDGNELSQAVTTSESSCPSPVNHGGTDQPATMATSTFSEKENVNIPRCDKFISDSTVASSELGGEVLDPEELEFKACASPKADEMDPKELSPHESSTVAIESVEKTGTVASNSPKKSDLTEFTEDLLPGVFPEENKKAQSEKLDELVKPLDVLENCIDFVESLHPTEAECLPCEGPADVMLLQIREGSPEKTMGEYLEHCSSSDLLSDLKQNEEKGPKVQEGKEEASTETGWTRTSEENESGLVQNEDCTEKSEKLESPSLEIENGEKHNEDCLSTEKSEKLESPSLEIENGEKHNDGCISTEKSEKLESQSLENGEKHNEDLVITAVALVTVAVASAMAKVELSQQLADELSSESPKLAEDTNESHDQSTNDFDSEPQAHIKVVDLETLDCGTPVVAPIHKEDVNSKSALDNLFPLTLSEEDKLLNTLPATHHLSTDKADNQGQTQTQIHLPCPSIDTGQQSEVPVNKMCSESGLHDPGDSVSVECLTGMADVDVEEGPEKTKMMTMESNSNIEGFADEPQSHCQAAEHEVDSHPVDLLHERESDTSTLQCKRCNSPPFTDPSLEELPGSAATKSIQLQPFQSFKDPNLVTSTFPSDSNEPSSVKDVCVVPEEESLNAVDGWKHRERRKLEAGKDALTVQDTLKREAEKLPAPDEVSEQTGRDSNSSHTICREKDLCYSVKPCAEPSQETSSIDIQPDRDDGVSVCVLQRVCESLPGSSDLDDGIFKKPYPLSSAGDGDKGVLTDDVEMQGDITLTEGASQTGSASNQASQSFRQSRKPETQNRDGGVAEGAGCGKEIEKNAQRSEDPSSSAVLRASLRSLSPLRRHSWEPGQSSTVKDADISQRSLLKNLSGEARRAKPPLHRRSMSWCPSNLCRPDQEQIDNRSYSLERLEVQRGDFHTRLNDQEERAEGKRLCLDSQERGSLISLTEEEQEDGISTNNPGSSEDLSVTSSCPAKFHHQTLTKSISMVAISHRSIDVRGLPRSKKRISFSLSISPLLNKNRRFFSIGSSSSDDDDEEEGGRLSSFSSNCSTLEYSISEEEPGPLRSEIEGKVQGPKISRTFSYLRSKMSKKSKEKGRGVDKERETKDKEKKTANGHVFIQSIPSPSTACHHCTKLIQKETFLCNNCGVHVHKSCRECLPTCTKSKTMQQLLVPDGGSGTTGNTRNKSTSSASPASSASSSLLGDRWASSTTPDDQFGAFPWKPSNILTSHSNLSKSVSISNIAGLDDAPLKCLKFLSQSTDNLHQGSKVNASTESLTDEGTEMIDSQLMGDFECDIKDLEADSWSSTVEKKFLKTLKKDEIKRQDVIYELYQTEFHHVRTLKIMSEVYYKGLHKEIQLDTQTLDKVFPLLDDLLDLHTQFLSRLLETRRASTAAGRKNNSVLICQIGSVLVAQFSDAYAEQMKKVYGKFCSRHNEAVNLYKDLHAKDKRFQAFIKKTMSNSIVRRLSIPECILLVTQRITKYPVLIQRILQHTKESDEDHSLVCEALRCVKELITAVDNKVNEHEKKRRLREVYSRTDSKSIMRMKSGQMFAKEDLIRGRKLLHDGALQLKNTAGRLKDVHAMLLSDVLVFLQEKDQKYVFASLDQRSTVVSLQNLIVREVANEEKGLFLISAGTNNPEMVEVLASSKEERNTWRTIIQDAMHCMEKDDDEGVPSETEEDRKQQESRAREIRELLRKKDEQIVSLLEEKVHIFRDLSDCVAFAESVNAPVREQMLFRATPDEVTKGEPVIRDALREVESLHALVNRGFAGAGCSAPAGPAGNSLGPVCLPRRAETFGGFDSHQMNSKNGEKEDGDESLDLRRTESDSLLKKGAAASLQMMLKRSTEQLQQTVTHLHDLLITLQAIVVQQDSFIEDQRQALVERLSGNCSRHSSSSSLSSSASSSRPSSLVEQEKHRSLERHRQEAASLQKQQAAHQEERRRKEREWELKERGLGEWEERLKEEEQETRRRQQDLAEEKESLQRKTEDLHRDMERMREAQRKLERDKETLRRDTERLEAARKEESQQLQRFQRTPSSTSEESLRFQSCGSLDLEPKEAAELPKEVELSSSAPTKEPFLRIGSKRMSKNFNPFSSSSSSSSKPQGAEKESQLPNRLLQLAKPKEKKDKKKKKGKGGDQTTAEAKSTVMLDPHNDGNIFFC